MFPRLLAILFLGLVMLQAEEWRVSLPGWTYQFPEDHGNHEEFKTEWWYFTGNLSTEEGRRFGYQLTFFRQGILPPGLHEDVTSRFVARNIPFAHFAVSDLQAGKFSFDQRISRGAFGEAVFGEGENLAKIKDWSCRLVDGRVFVLEAKGEDFSIQLEMENRKEPVIHGREGVSQKAEGEGRASHYYSLTRLKTRGTVTTAAGTFPVTGLSWFDHEWATNQLTENQVGWDWFSLQFDDGTDLMIFQIRTKDGGRDPYSGGTFVHADGRLHEIKNDFGLEAGKRWKSPKTRGDYPVEWRLRVPSLDMDVKVTAAMPHQELVLDPISYWEGAIVASGTRGGKKVEGRGYLEMTGYGSPIVGMQAASNVTEEGTNTPDNKP